MVTIELGTEDQDLLTDGAIGAYGWMVAFAPDEETATERLIESISNFGLRAAEIEDMAEVFGYEEVNEFDEVLANNLRDAAADALTVWGTLFTFPADGEA